jgi:hypothetical protein
MSTSWVPVEACTIPTADQPLRVAEFDDLFATALRDVERREPGWLRLRLDPGSEERARDLVARETACCSFFTFDVHHESDLVVDVRVPDARVDVLDALQARL